MTVLNEYEKMFNTVLSLHFGRTFWIDDDNNLCSAPTYKDGSTHWEQWDYVSEWTDLEGVNLDKLLDVHRTCLEYKNYGAEDFT